MIKKKKHDKMELLAKSKLTRKEVLISQVLINSVITHDEFFLINNLRKECKYVEEEIKDLIT